ncbi:MAG: WD40 repeat domain-containing protein [Promethearchaeota archaeon]
MNKSNLRYGNTILLVILGVNILTLMVVPSTYTTIINDEKSYVQPGKQGLPYSPSIVSESLHSTLEQQNASLEKHFPFSSKNQQQSVPSPRQLNFSSELHPEASRPPFTDSTSRVQALAVGDFNNDSIPDVAVGSWVGDSNVYFIDGATGTTLYTNTDPIYWVDSLAVGDFNNDSIPDVAAGSSDDIYFIDGATGITMYTNTDPTNRVQALAVGDFNNDSIPDVAAGSDDTTVYFIDGKTGTTLYTNTDSTGKVLVIGVADFNNDSIPDVSAGMSLPADYTVYFINGKNGSTMYTNADPVEVTALAVGDFNNDSIPDVAAEGGYNVYFIDGTTGGTMYTNTDPTSGVGAIVVADFNNDAIPDVVAGSSDSNVYFIDGNGTTMYTNTDATSYVRALAVGDFNNDSIPDVAAGSWDSNVYFIDGTTGTTMYTNTDATSYVRALAVGDFNNDSILDITAGSEDTNVYFIFSDRYAPVLQYCLLPVIPTTEVIWEFQVILDEPNLDTIFLKYYDSNNSIAQVEPLKITPNIAHFSILPFQSDLLKFWFWANDTWGHTKAQGNETNSYTLRIFQQHLFTNSDPIGDVYVLAAGDFNDDGSPDVAAHDFTAGRSTVYFIDGVTGTTMYNNSDPSRTDWIDAGALVVADFNNDAIPDVAAGSRDSNVYFIDGTTGSTMYINTDPTSSVKAIVVADFNNDAIPDVAAGSWDSNVYFIDGSTGTTLYTNTDPTEAIITLVMADFNNDAIPDVAAGGWHSTVYFINGATGTTLYTNTDSLREIEAMAVGDFNNDSIPDVAAGSPDSNVYFIDGGTGTTIYTNTDPTREVEALVVADFNNDGIFDVAAGAAETVYFIDGVTGTTMYTTNLGIPISLMFVEDIVRSSIPDLVVASHLAGDIFIIDSHAGRIQERVSLDFTNILSIVLEDFDQNGLVDIALGGSGSVSVVQPLSPFSNMVSTFFNPLTIAQGHQLTFTAALRDRWNRGIGNATVTLVVRKSGTETFLVYPSGELWDGFYNFSLFTTDWEVGEWELYMLAARAPYTPLALVDYQTMDGMYLPAARITVRGNISADFVLSSETGFFSPETGFLSRVRSGSNITLQGTLQDAYYHLLTESDASLVVSFNNQTYVATFIEAGKAITYFTTQYMASGTYNLSITITGQYLTTIQHTLTVEIIPWILTLFVSSDPPLTLSQGATLNFTATLYDALDTPLDHANVTLYVRREGTNTFASYLGIERANGSYQFSVPTSDWRIGKWELYFTATRAPYNNLALTDYQVTEDTYVPARTLTLTSKLVPSFYLETEGGVYSSGLQLLSNVVAGSNITLRIDLQDSYHHSLTSEDVSISVSFNDQTYGMDVVTGSAIGTIPTQGLKHGEYTISILIIGQYLEDYFINLKVQIIPQQPGFGVPPVIFFLLAILSVGFSGIFIIGIYKLYRSTTTDSRKLWTTVPPNNVELDEKETTSVEQLLTKLKVLVGLLIITTFGSALLLFTEPVWAFLLVCVALGEITLLFFLWFYSSLYSRLLRFKLLTSFKTWLPTIFMIVVLLLFVFVSLLLTFIIATQTQWFEYLIQQGGQINLLNIPIPSLLWTIAISSFATGFLVYVIAALYNTYSNTKELKALYQEIQAGYHDLSQLPHLLQDQIGKNSQKALRSLSLLLLLWYAAILYTFVTTFQIYEYTFFLLVAGLPALLPFVVIILLVIWDWINLVERLRNILKK